MSWVVVYTKPREETRAKVNLENLGFEVYLPIIMVEALRNGRMTLDRKPLFPRYMFVRNDTVSFDKNFSKLRSTRGVSTLVSIGGMPAMLGPETITAIQKQEADYLKRPAAKFHPGDKLKFNHGPFSDIEAVFLEKNGDARVVLLFKMFEKMTKITVPLSALTKYE